MPAIDCSIVNKHFYDILKEIKDWSDLNKNKKYFKDPYEAAVRLVETEFGTTLELLQNNQDLTAGQTSSFRARLRELTRSVENGSIDNKFAQLFWQTSHIGKKDPVVGSVLGNMQRSGYFFRGHELRDRSLVKSLFENLREAAMIKKLLPKFGGRGAEKELQRLDDAWKAAIADFKNKKPGADDKIIKIRKEIDDLVQTTHLKVYDDVLNIIEGAGKEVGGKFVWESGLPKIVQDKYNKITDPKVKEKIDSGERRIKLTKNDLAGLDMFKDRSIDPKYKDAIYRSLETYMELTDGLYQTLRNGVDKRIDSIIKKLEVNGDKMSAGEMAKIKDRLRGKLMPKYEVGFFPHYTRDLNAHMMDGLMPFFEDMHSSVNHYERSSKHKPIRDIISEMNTYIDGHTTRRARDLESGEYDYDYSRNLFNSISNYVFDVNRFNYTAFMDAHMIDGLMAVESIYKKDGMAKGYAESLTNYLIDLNAASNGDAKVSESTRNFMRTLLGFEFISKLGINPRGAFRNATQRFLDYVHWGPVQIKKTRDYLKTLTFKGGDADGHITKILKDAGLLFDEVSPELVESGLQAPASMFKTISWNESTGKYESHKTSRMEKIANKVSVIAGKSSFLHRKAENSNRKHTFKIAYAQMHRWLNTPDFKNREMEKAAKTKKGKERIEKGRKPVSDAEMESKIIRASENYAINMVVMNHFDYADYAKSRLLTKPLGRFLGQFQHYSFEFFERNLQIFREAKHDVMQGKLLPSNSAQGLQKAYRMSFIYFLAPVIASALTGVNFSNIVEHDTGQRINQLATLLTGDDDEIQQAFYGKGPIISTFGGPITSDIIDIGVMLDLIDLDDDSLFTLIGGLEQYDPSNQSTEASKKIRILNTFLGRFFERHLPQIQKGRLGWAAQQELGLYPTAESKKVQKKAKAATEAVLTPELQRALESLAKGV